MARVTVEDCLEHVENRFELVMVASKRARDLSTGAKDALVPWDQDKPTVVALREIAAGLVTSTYLDKSSQTQDEDLDGGEGGFATIHPINYSEPL